jgi:hypothetical protein
MARQIVILGASEWPILSAHEGRQSDRGVSLRLRLLAHRLSARRGAWAVER